jgi:hypothetical protein
MTQTQQRLIGALLLFSIHCGYAVPSLSQASSSEDAATVKRIMTTVLARCYSKTNGITRIAFEPPKDQDVAEIKAIGDRAIPLLAAYLDSQQKDGFTQLFAVKFLVAIGGPATFAPLQRASAEDQWEVTRAAALDGMFAVSESRAKLFIKAALEDKSQLVRRRAQALWALYREYEKSK